MRFKFFSPLTFLLCGFLCPVLSSNLEGWIFHLEMVMIYRMYKRISLTMFCWEIRYWLRYDAIWSIRHKLWWRVLFLVCSFLSFVPFRICVYFYIVLLLSTLLLNNKHTCILYCTEFGGFWMLLINCFDFTSPFQNY